MDNDGQWSQPYPFTITIREVRRVFYVKDHLGNIRQSLNESGTVVAAQDYYPYGEFISGRSYNSGHPLEKYRFTEKERDIETNFDNFGGRLYDGALGIWLQVDPLTDKYPGVSPYNYVMNNPLKYVDPDGLEIRGKKKEDAEEAACRINEAFEQKKISNYTAVVKHRTEENSWIAQLFGADATSEIYYVALEGKGSFESNDPKLNEGDNATADAGFEALKSVIESKEVFTFAFTDKLEGVSISERYGGGFAPKGTNEFYISPYGNQQGYAASNNRWGESPLGIFFHEVIHLNKNSLKGFSPHPNNANKMNKIFNYNNPGPHK